MSSDHTQNSETKRPARKKVSNNLNSLTIALFNAGIKSAFIKPDSGKIPEFEGMANSIVILFHEDVKDTYEKDLLMNETLATLQKEVTPVWGGLHIAEYYSS